MDVEQRVRAALQAHFLRDGGPTLSHRQFNALVEAVVEIVEPSKVTNSQTQEPTPEVVVRRTE